MRCTLSPFIQSQMFIGLGSVTNLTFQLARNLSVDEAESNRTGLKNIIGNLIENVLCLVVLIGAQNNKKEI